MPQDLHDILNMYGMWQFIEFLATKPFKCLYILMHPAPGFPKPPPPPPSWMCPHNTEWRSTSPQPTPVHSNWTELSITDTTEMTLPTENYTMNSSFPSNDYTPVMSTRPPQEGSSGNNRKGGNDKRDASDPDQNTTPKNGANKKSVKDVKHKKVKEKDTESNNDITREGTVTAEYDDPSEPVTSTNKNIGIFWHDELCAEMTEVFANITYLYQSRNMAELANDVEKYQSTQASQI